jgi:hypothetical protein
MAYIKVADGEPKIAADQDDASSSLGVKLEWDPILSRYFMSSFPSDSPAGPLKWKITGLDIREVLDYGDSNGPETSAIYDGFQGDFDFLQNTYLIEGLAPGTHLISGRLLFREVLTEGSDGNEEVLNLAGVPGPWQHLTITIPDQQQFFNRTGVPPNWNVIPSPLAMIPSVVRVVNEMIVFLDNIEKLLESSSDKVKKFVEQLKKTIDRYVLWAKDVAKTITDLIEALQYPDIYAGYTTFNGQGGNSLMMNQIGQALFSGDSKAPPFNDGTEPVLGLVIMAGSNSAGAITNFMKSMQLVFGTNFASSADATTASIDNAWNAAVESIDVLMEDTERQIEFTDSMIAQISYTLPEAETPQPAFGIDMQPSTEAVGCG